MFDRVITFQGKESEVLKTNDFQITESEAIDEKNNFMDQGINKIQNNL